MRAGKLHADKKNSISSTIWTKKIVSAADKTEENSTTGRETAPSQRNSQCWGSPPYRTSSPPAIFPGILRSETVSPQMASVRPGNRENAGKWVITRGKCGGNVDCLGTGKLRKMGRSVWECGNCETRGAKRDAYSIDAHPEAEEKCGQGGSHAGQKSKEMRGRNQEWNKSLCPAPRARQASESRATTRSCKAPLPARRSVAAARHEAEEPKGCRNGSRKVSNRTETEVAK